MPKEHLYKPIHEWPESCTALIGFKVPPSMKAKIKEIPEWQEFCRKAIAEKLAQEDP